MIDLIIINISTKGISYSSKFNNSANALNRQSRQVL